MNQREQFLQNFRSVFIGMVERLDTMTESQVLRGILEVKTARNMYKEEFAERIGALTQAGPRERPRLTQATGNTRDVLAYLVSIQALFKSVNRLNELRSRAGAKAPPLGSLPFGALEDALKERLDALRKRPTGDA